MEFTSGATQQIDKLYQGRKHVELTIGILRDGKQEIRHWNPERKETDAELIYPVGSICKPFVASLLAKCISEGKLDLKVPISEYLPDLPKRYYPNLEKLATHTSGFTTQPYTLLTTIPFFLKMNRSTPIPSAASWMMRACCRSSGIPSFRTSRIPLSIPTSA